MTIKVIWLNSKHGREVDFFQEEVLFNGRIKSGKHFYKYGGNIYSADFMIKRFKKRIEIIYKDTTLNREMGNEIGKMILTTNRRINNWKVNWEGNETKDDRFKVEKSNDKIRFKEGGRSQITHESIERDSGKLNKLKIERMNKLGSMKCEICEFDFKNRYKKEIANGYIAAHHLNPLSRSVKRVFTDINDIILVCPNCHSMIHKIINLYENKNKWNTTVKLKINILK